MTILDKLEPVDPALIEPFLAEMRDKVIPDIVRTLEERAEARWRNMYQTECTMHRAWRKRAEEAEDEVRRVKAQSLF